MNGANQTNRVSCQVQRKLSACYFKDDIEPSGRMHSSEIYRLLVVTGRVTRVMCVCKNFLTLCRSNNYVYQTRT